MWNLGAKLVQLKRVYMRPFEKKLETAPIKEDPESQVFTRAYQGGRSYSILKIWIETILAKSRLNLINEID
jgi:hypothetical protein